MGHDETVLLKKSKLNDKFVRQWDDKCWVQIFYSKSILNFCSNSLSVQFYFYFHLKFKKKKNMLQNTQHYKNDHP